MGDCASVSLQIQRAPCRAQPHRHGAMTVESRLHRASDGESAGNMHFSVAATTVRPCRENPLRPETLGIDNKSLEEP